MEQRTAGQPAANPNRAHLEELVQELRELEDRLRQGGGADKIERQHSQGKLTARERIARLLDPGARFQEVGLLVAYDEYDGQAPSAGVVTGFGLVAGREVVVVANDATVKAGSWWPETIKKMLRAQEIAMRCRTPIVYLVDSAGVNSPYQGGVFPGQYGAARIFYYNSVMGLGEPNLVKGATGQKVSSETLGGARIHNAISGVAHYRSKNDEECIDKIREI